MRQLGVVAGCIGVLVGATVGFGIGCAAGLLVVLLTQLFFNPLIWIAHVLSQIIGIDAVSIAEWIILGIAAFLGIVYGGWTGWLLGYGLVVKR